MSANVIDQFQRHLRDQDLSARTVIEYGRDVLRFATWLDAQGEPFALDVITTPTITRYRAALQQRELSPAAINRQLVTLKRLCAWAQEFGLASTDAARPVKLIPAVKSSPRELSDREESALVAAVTKFGTARDKAMLILMLHTGLRAMEVCNLKIADISINIRSGSLQVRGGKRNKFRSVPLNITARTALSEYLSPSKPADWLFPSERGGRLGERALRYIVEKYARIARIEDVSPHDLRHRFGYRMAEKTPLHRLAQLMGHDSLNTTLIYVGATEKDLQAEVDKIAWE